MNKQSNRILFILIVFLILFLSLIVYLTYFQLVKAEEVKLNTYNQRIWIAEEEVKRGSFFDRNGTELARNDINQENNLTYRVYNYGNLYSHIIGYNYREYGKSGLELRYNDPLLDKSEIASLDEVKAMLIEDKIGNDIKLTIDHGLQSYTRDMLAGKKGAAIVMNPKTGEIYSMVSQPDYDVSKLRENFQEYKADERSPMINRAIQGLYEPGSTFKVLTALALMENPEISQEYECSGESEIHGYTFEDYSKTADGHLDLERALEVSCNTYFANKAVEIGPEKMGKIADRMYIGKDIPFDLNVEKSRFDTSKIKDDVELAASGIGQGNVLMTPLNMAMITSSIANNGDIMKPRLVNEIISPKGKTIRTFKEEKLVEAVKPEIAEELKNKLQAVVDYGTATSAQISGVNIAGKSGTAENPSGKTHAWFIGLAPVEEPRFTIVVVLEEEGQTGGAAAAPIARELLRYSINNL